MSPPAPSSPYRHWPATITLLVVVIATAVILLAMGRVPICTCGEIKLWTGDVISSDNSQHLSDWYTPSHIIHGFLFYWLFHVATPGLSIGWRAVGATVLEAAWEILENSPIIIDRYREATISLDYYGDSILNSSFDVVFMTMGFLIAARIPWLATLLIALSFEIFTAVMIRDNLSLNVLMLLWPVEAVKTWQGG